MAAATLRAQAKINLFLRVTGREASGYHALETLFCRLALADVVSVRLTRATRSLDCSGPELPAQGLGTAAENLAWRAAVAYADTAHYPSGFEIALEKHVPVRAGLGGGSADAGAVLRLLNALNPRPLDAQVLHDIARALGADVPFLTQDQTVLALAFGRGDELQALPALPERHCLLAIPPVDVATPAAYSWIDEDRGWTGREISAGTGAQLPGTLAWDDVRRLAQNDFEDVVFPRHPEVAAAWRYVAGLLERVDPLGIVRLSGSGAAVFGITAAPLSAQEIPHQAGLRTVQTRTAARVESVEPID